MTAIHPAKPDSPIFGGERLVSRIPQPGVRQAQELGVIVDDQDFLLYDILLLVPSRPQAKTKTDLPTSVSFPRFPGDQCPITVCRFPARTALVTVISPSCIYFMIPWLILLTNSRGAAYLRQATPQLKD
ncbi:hypothetical protein ACFLYR_06950 [Chloroflexota bacterium]